MCDCAYASTVFFDVDSVLNLARGEKGMTKMQKKWEDDALWVFGLLDLLMLAGIR
jgi:hypothetical protein